MSSSPPICRHVCLSCQLLAFPVRLCASLCFTFLYLPLSLCPTCPSVISVSHNSSGYVRKGNSAPVFFHHHESPYSNCKYLHLRTCDVAAAPHPSAPSITGKQNQRDALPSIKRSKLDMEPKWRPAVKKTSGHASMPLSLAVHRELIGVTTP